MKIHARLTLAAALFALGFAAVPARADWFYNTAANYITNAASGAAITVSKYATDGTDALKATALRTKASDNAYDFSMQIVDAANSEWVVTYHANYLSAKGQTSVILSPRTTYLQKDFMYNASTLTNFAMNCPLMTSIGEYAVNGASQLTGVSASVWDLRSLVTFGNGALKDCAITGALKLPACTVLNGQSFRSLTKLEELWLTSPNLPANAFDYKERFAGLLSLTNLVLGASAQMTAAGRPVSGWDAIATPDGSLKKLQRVTFYGPAPTIRVFSSLFNQTTYASPATLNLTVYASKNQIGWTSLPGLITDTNAIVTALGANAALYPDKIGNPKLIGLYPIQELSVKYAWIVHERSPYDPPIIPQSVVVESGPVPLTDLGEASPTYGTQSEVADGTVFTVAQYAGRDGALYEATGFVGERLDSETDDWIVFTNGTGRVWTYQETEEQLRLTWLFEVADGYGVMVPGNGLAFIESMTTPLCGDDLGNPYYATGTTVTMTAEDNPPEQRFWSWRGDVASSDRTISFTINRTMTLAPAMCWYYASGTITDPVTGSKFNISVESAANSALRLASRVTAAVDKTYDFSKPILDAGATRWFLTHYNNVFANKNDMREMTLSRESVAVAKDFAIGCSTLEKLVLDCPNLVSLGNYAFSSASFSRTDTATWNLSSLTTLGGGVFQSSGLSGILEMSSLVSMLSAEFMNTKITDLRLTSENLSATVFNPHQIFWACTAITNLVMGGTAAQDAPTRASSGDSAIGCGGAFSKLEAATFYGPAPTARFLTSLLSANTLASPSNLRLTLFGSRNQESWTSLVGLITDRAAIRTVLGAYAEQYESILTSGRLIGLYPIPGLSGKYAWIRHQSSPYDPLGTLILIR